MPEHLSPELKRIAGPLTPYFESVSSKTIASYDSTFVPFGNGLLDGKLDTAVAGLETEMIKGSLARNNWNISRVASELGLTRRGLYMKLARYGIEKSA